MGTFLEALIPGDIIDGMEANFASRVAESQRRVFQIAYSLLRNVADAEDVAQEVFLRAHRRFTALRDAEKFQAWVSRIAFRLALNRQRDRGRQLTRDSGWVENRSDGIEDGERSAEDKLFLQRVREEIDRLPPKLHWVIVLCGVQEMDAQQVAEILEIPVGTVRSRLHLARKKLLERLQP